MTAVEPPSAASRVDREAYRRAAHYAESHAWLTAEYAEPGKTQTDFL